MTNRKPNMPARARYVFRQVTPPTLQKREPLEFTEWTHGNKEMWAEYDRKRAAGLVHPPSVSTRTDADVERSRRAHGAGREDRAIVGHFPF